MAVVHDIILIATYWYNKDLQAQSTFSFKMLLAFLLLQNLSQIVGADAMHIMKLEEQGREGGGGRR